MPKTTTLDEIKNLRLINDKPIRILLFFEAISNIGFIAFVYLCPSLFLSLFHQHDKQITPLTTHILQWWNSWLFVITGLMFAAIPSTYNTPTLTAGLIHVRRFLYWGLLSSEIFLIYLLLSSSFRTNLSIAFSILFGFVILGRLIILFPKQSWFGTVILDSPSDKTK